MAKKTYKQIIEFKRIATARLATSDPNTENKLTGCLHDLVGNVQTGELGSLAPIIDAFFKEKRKIARKHASVDESENIIKDQNDNYVFTKQAEELCEEEFELLYNKEGEFEPSICDAPNDLIPAEKAAYKGFVIA